MASRYIPGRADKDNLARWSKYASDNSYRPTKSEKAGGPPKMQDSNNGRYTAPTGSPTSASKHEAKWA